MRGGLELARTEAAGTPEERTITTEWHSEFRLPTRLAEPGRVSEFSYDNAGRLLSKTETDPASSASRPWTYTYTAQGLLASVDGPRMEGPDRTTYTYDVQGNLATVTNALGHVTRITQYDAHGRPLRIEEPNGAITELRYDARGRLLSQSINGSMTRFDYDPAGNLNKLTLSTGGFYSYRYDAAQRLTGITDKLGNRIVYILDALGNRVREDIHDPAGALTYTQERVYANRNRLLQDVGGMGQTTEYSYDAQGNLTARIDPLNHPTQLGYDALNRRLAVTDALAGVTEYRYDGRDNVVAITDPTGLRTRYTYDGLDNLLETESPDTGTTSASYDAAGNRLSATDARGVTARYQYDALNRLTVIDYPGTVEDLRFRYDAQSTAGLGRLTRVWDASGVSAYYYYTNGKLYQETTVRDGVRLWTRYHYTAARQVSTLTYPSGRQVRYTYDAAGRVSAVTTTFNGVTTVLASSVRYQPFGPLKRLTFGHGLVLTRDHDRAYRLSAQTTAPCRT